MNYMIEINDSKGEFPPTPHVLEYELEASYKSVIPKEAKEFAQKVLKQYLLTMSDKEADCKCKSLIIVIRFGSINHTQMG